MIDYVAYEHFNLIPEKERRYILRYLGISGGVMRHDAKMSNPKCIVAYKDGVPIGWATSRKVFNGHELNVFVKKSERRAGIGTKLIELIRTKDSFGSTYNKDSQKFYEAVKKLRINKEW
jgi:hypothetical protein